MDKAETMSEKLADCRKKQKALGQNSREHFTKKWGNTHSLFQELCPVNIGILLDPGIGLENSWADHRRCAGRNAKRGNSDFVPTRWRRNNQTQLKAGEKPAKVAETAEIPKTAPQPSQKPEKPRKVAETAEIPKTAPQTQPKSRKKPRKVAETAEISKTASQTQPKSWRKDLAKSSWNHYKSQNS